MGLARTLLSPLLPGDDHLGEGVHGLLMLPLRDRHDLGFGELQDDGTPRSGSAHVLLTHDRHNVEFEIDGTGQDASACHGAGRGGNQQHSQRGAVICQEDGADT